MSKDFQDFHMVQTPIQYPQLVAEERKELLTEELLIMGNGHGKFKWFGQTLTPTDVEAP